MLDGIHGAHGPLEESDDRLMFWTEPKPEMHDPHWSVYLTFAHGHCRCSPNALQVDDPLSRDSGDPEWLRYDDEDSRNCGMLSMNFHKIGMVRGIRERAVVVPWVRGDERSE